MFEYHSPREPANDNPVSSLPPALIASLRHFARTGMAAETIARCEARQAEVVGDAAKLRRYLAICEAFHLPTARRAA